MRDRPRIPPLSADKLDPSQLALLDSMVSGKRGRSAANGGPFGVWLHSPAFGMEVQRFGEYVRYDTSLEPAISELLILCCATHWRAQYEWYVHAPIAASSGVPGEVIEALRTGSDIPATRLENENLTPLLLETSRPGIFAVGDVRSGSVKRVAAAIGEGSMAVRLAFERLQSAGTADPVGLPTR